MTLTISLPPDAESKLRERARAIGQDVSQYVEQLVAHDIATGFTSTSGSVTAQGRDSTNSLEDQYKQGYALVPEDIADTQALLPHLAVESEEWQ